MALEERTPLEQALMANAVERTAVIGLPAANEISERRFALTPEGAGMLVERGFKVRMEAGAANSIHYADEAYMAKGVEIVDRAKAFGGDIVVYLPHLTVADARLLKRGALLLTFLHADTPDDAAVFRTLLNRHIIALSLELITDTAGRHPFADILHEIDGRAAIAIASSLLADAIHGKGILLGGVAGIIPCEVTVIGSDMAACAAARSAIGLGASVRMFDNNIYRLREALAQIGPGAVGSAMHPRVFESALRSADIVVATDTEPVTTSVGADLAATMKKGVIAFDLTSHPGRAFPSMQLVDLDLASPGDNLTPSPARYCYINAGNAVPRTVAMALSNTFTTVLDEILVCDGVSNALRLNGGLRSAVLTFLGKCVNTKVARITGTRPVDINIFLQFS